jgi:hypothetical protein
MIFCRLSRTTNGEVNLTLPLPARPLADPRRQAGCKKERPAVLPSRACSLKAN